MWRRFDAWVERGGYTSRDVSIFRIVYASVAVVFFPSYSWIARFDDSFFQPAPGPMRLFVGFPPAPFFYLLDGVVGIALLCVLLGLFTVPASVVLSLALLVGEGFAFSFGKIDHSILFVLTPLFLSAAGWGDHFSVDAMRRRGVNAPSRMTSGMLRAFAVFVGVCFVTGALPKIRGGWLDPSTQATFAFVIQRVERGRSDWLIGPLSSLHVPIAWEALDWATVSLEFGLLFLVIQWRAWRVGLSFAALFHLGVLVSLDIDFWMNVLAYGAFVQWTSMPWGPLRRIERWFAAHPPVSMGLAGLAVVGLAIRAHGGTPLTESLGWVVVVAGAAVAIGYLLSLLVGWRRGRGAKAGRNALAMRKAGLSVQEVGERAWTQR